MCQLFDNRTMRYGPSADFQMWELVLALFFPRSIPHTSHSFFSNVLFQGSFFLFCANSLAFLERRVENPQ